MHSELKKVHFFVTGNCYITITTTEGQPEQQRICACDPRFAGDRKVW